MRPVRVRLVGVRPIGIKPVAPFIRSPVAGYDRQRGLQSEVEHRLGRQLDLLTLGGCLHAATQSAAGGRANRGSLASARDGANDGSDTGAGADFGGRVLAS